MPRPYSEVWKYFNVLDGGNGRQRKTSCKYCGREQTCGVTRLQDHLIRRCTQIPASLKQLLHARQEDNVLKRKRRLEERSNGRSERHHLPAPVLPPPSTSTQSNEDPAYDGMNRALRSLAERAIPNATPLAPAPTTTTNTVNTVSQRTQSMLDWHLARALFSSNTSLKAVEDPHMAEFLRLMRPGYVVPRAHRLQQYLLKEQHWDLIPDPASHADDLPSPPPPPAPSGPSLPLPPPPAPHHPIHHQPPFGLIRPSSPHRSITPHSQAASSSSASSSSTPAAATIATATTTTTSGTASPSQSNNAATTSTHNIPPPPPPPAAAAVSSTSSSASPLPKVHLPNPAETNNNNNTNSAGNNNGATTNTNTSTAHMTNGNSRSSKTCIDGSL
ncbi:hypothetical protein BCR43DRAFT_498337 [Syncephalastrum racemosum]|uniref:BED-type domain-containing protein n=1 Tax=Syncephalastrum racemosum TaxID=13706 RepID=A0A1X2H1V6_SYNRA|nr:hypothetical protein BCR43DRAFT_498337 [Syncephalastrum racemosum]